MSNQFEKKVIDAINSFRQTPTTIQKECEMVQKGLSRLKAGDPFLEEIAVFTNGLKRMKSLPPLEYNEVLSEAAADELKKFKSDSSYPPIKDERTIKGVVPDFYLIAHPVLIADDGADEPSNVVTKVLLNRLDKTKLGRQILCDPRYTQIGIKQTQVDQENYVIMILAEKYIEEETFKLPEGDLTELKKAFDILDTNGTQKLDMALTMEIISALGLEKTNPTLYSIFSDLNDKKKCSWPKFASVAHGRMVDKITKNGITTIFNLFINNKNKNVLDMRTYKQIMEEINMDIPDNVLIDMFKACTTNGKELTYKEFEELMMEESTK